MTDADKSREVTLQDLHDALFEMRHLPAAISAVYIEIQGLTDQMMLNTHQVQRLTSLAGELRDNAKRIETALMDLIVQRETPTLPCAPRDEEPPSE